MVHSEMHVEYKSVHVTKCFDGFFFAAAEELYNCLKRSSHFSTRAIHFIGQRVSGLETESLGNNAFIAILHTFMNVLFHVFPGKTMLAKIVPLSGLASMTRRRK